MQNDVRNLFVLSSEPNFLSIPIVNHSSSVSNNAMKLPASTNCIMHAVQISVSIYLFIVSIYKIMPRYNSSNDRRKKQWQRLFDQVNAIIFIGPRYDNFFQIFERVY